MDDNDEKDQDCNDDDGSVPCAPSALSNGVDYMMDDGGHDNVGDDEDGDVVTFAPSALFNL